MILSAIVAMDRTGLIGADGRIPWHLPRDRARFRKLTWGRPVILGRKTWDSLPEQPLPGRLNIVLSRDPDFQPPLAFACRSIAGAIELAADHAGLTGVGEAFIIGGADVYRQAANLWDRLYLTIVGGEFQGDTYTFCYWNNRDVVLTDLEYHPADGENPHDCTFAVIERRRSTDAPRPDA